MASEVRYEARGEVAVLTLDRPVANALAPSLRVDLASALSQAISAPEVQAIVLNGAGKDFSIGCDVAEYDRPLVEPWIDTLCTQIENSPKPVVAALHGAVLAGGLELALAAHFRLAEPNARLGLPEIDIGLLPSGGTTQRVPRLVGPEPALDLLLTGKKVSAQQAQAIGLIDAVAEEEPVLDVAIAKARDLYRTGAWGRTRDQSRGFSDPDAYHKALTAARAHLARKTSPVVARDVVYCVEAAQLLPFERGAEVEKTRFLDELDGEFSRAKRYVVAAKRRARAIPERARGPAHAIHSVTILAGHSPAATLAVACLNAGWNVQVAGLNPGENGSIRDGVRRIFDGAVSRGKLATETRDKRMARLSVTAEGASDRVTDLVFDMRGTYDGAGAIFTGVPGVVRVVGAVGEAAPEQIEPGDAVVFARLYEPAHFAKLVEITWPDGAPAEAIATAATAFENMGKSIVHAPMERGMIGHQIWAAMVLAALKLVESGAAPSAVDLAAESMGFRVGPFRRMDAEGIAASSRWLRDSVRGPETLQGFPGRLLSEMAEHSAGTQTSVRSFFRYGGGRALGDPDTIALIRDLAPTPRPISEPLTQAFLAKALNAAVVNEAARLTAQGTVRRPSDIDVVLVDGYDFDQARGGVLFQADSSGLFGVYQDMKHMAEIAPALWKPHELIEDMVKNGDGFSGRAAYPGA